MVEEVEMHGVSSRGRWIGERAIREMVLGTAVQRLPFYMCYGGAAVTWTCRVSLRLYAAHGVRTTPPTLFVSGLPGYLILSSLLEYIAPMRRDMLGPASGRSLLHPVLALGWIFRSALYRAIPALISLHTRAFAHW